MNLQLLLKSMIQKNTKDKNKKIIFKHMVENISHNQNFKK